MIYLLQNSIDNIAHTNRLRYINPKLKVIFVILSLIVCVFSQSVIVPLIIATTMIILTLFIAKVPPKIYLGLLSAPIVFGIITVIMMGFIYGNGDIIYSLNILGFKIGFSRYGINMGLLVFSRMLGGVSSTLFLIFTTPMTELFYVLKDLKIPDILLELTMMVYRYIFVLLDELIRIENAQKTRLGYKDLKTTYKSLGILASSLFIRTWEKGETLFITMSARGYNGEFRMFGNIENPKLKYVLLILLFELFLVGLSIITAHFDILKLLGV